MGSGRKYTNYYENKRGKVILFAFLKKKKTSCSKGEKES